jgi:hypothetical protein
MTILLLRPHIPIAIVGLPIRAGQWELPTVRIRFDLSILGIKKRANTEKAPAMLAESPKKPAAKASKLPEAAVIPDVATVMIVDLKNLTQANLEAFFPSEQAAPKGDAATATDRPTPSTPTGTSGGENS